MHSDFGKIVAQNIVKL